MEDKTGTTRLPRIAEENTVDDLLVFGYASSLFPDDERAQYIAEERHLQSCNGDESLRIDSSNSEESNSQSYAVIITFASSWPLMIYAMDVAYTRLLLRTASLEENISSVSFRYDCRLLLSTIDLAINGDHHTASCPTEDLEEEMCEEERYKDMYKDIDSCDSESDSEDEPFEPPQGVKLPVGLIVPENQKQNHIIERTALFVVSKGPQMEIVIKAKQRNNMEQFGFLEFDNNLHPYYKYISKLIREKKYIPDLTKRLTRKTGILRQSSVRTIENERKHSNALAAIAERKFDYFLISKSVFDDELNCLFILEHGSDSDDSDSDYELHPSLIARNREKSPDIMDETDNAAGPRQRPSTPPEKVVSAIRTDYDMSKSNDMYASLFKNLTKVSNTKEERRKREQEQKLLHKHVVASAPPPPDEEFRKWWLSFYGTSCPFSHPPPMLPPPPDLEPVVTSYAEFVAQHGAEVEASLLNRPDLQLHFMHISSPHFSYYQHKVRCAQWSLAQQEKQVTSSYPEVVPPTSSAELDEQQNASTEVTTIHH
uniref:SURP motif domain-containing protein n=1 Tax=Heterorhabditis bacteriophora TaxID=37862 RepID=A0A1I7X8Q8_HETBA